MKNFVRIDSPDGDKISYFLQRSNIAGLSICPKSPTQINILMIGDLEPTPFTFPTVEERNKKLNEILEEEDYDSLFRNSDSNSGENDNNNRGTETP